MKRAVNALAVALLVAGLATATALGAPAKPWQAVAGHFKTKAAATTRMSGLSAKGFRGYRIETEKRGQFTRGRKYELEKAYASRKQAQAAVTRLHKAGFKASVEREKTER